MTALFDTNILIDHLRGYPQAQTELEKDDDRRISVVTWIEVMAGAETTATATRDYLQTYTIAFVDQAIADRAVDLRRRYEMKLPDALIWATAQILHIDFITRNTKDFPKDDPMIRSPYILQ